MDALEIDDAAWDAQALNDGNPPVAGLLSGTGATGLEPATSGVTGRRSNQLSYAPLARQEG